MPEFKNSASVRAFLWAVKEHWLTLMSGGIITVLLGVFERFSGKNVPLWIYVAILVFFAFLACYLAWRDARKELIQLTADDGRFEREFLAERLRTFLADEGKVDNHESVVMQMMLTAQSRDRIHAFLEKFYGPETVEQFDRQGLPLIQELLADCYRSNKKFSIRNTKSLDTGD